MIDTNERIEIASRTETIYDDGYSWARVIYMDQEEVETCFDVGMSGRCSPKCSIFAKGRCDLYIDILDMVINGDDAGDLGVQEIKAMYMFPDGI